jgi:hypothetical protein
MKTYAPERVAYKREKRDESEDLDLFWPVLLCVLIVVGLLTGLALLVSDP